MGNGGINKMKVQQTNPVVSRKLGCNKQKRQGHFCPAHVLLIRNYFRNQRVQTFE
jgi:hypothetical protein